MKKTTRKILGWALILIGLAFLLAMASDIQLGFGITFIGMGAKILLED